MIINSEHCTHVEWSKLAYHLSIGLVPQGTWVQLDCATRFCRLDKDEQALVRNIVLIPASGNVYEQFATSLILHGIF